MKNILNFIVRMMLHGFITDAEKTEIYIFSEWNNNDYNFGDIVPAIKDEVKMF